MSTKSYIYFAAVLLSLVAFALAGCGGTSTSQNGQGAISAKLVWSGTKTAGKTVALAPAGVSTVRLAVSGAGITAISQDFQAADGQGTLSRVPVGSGLTLTASGLDASGTIIYQGSVGSVAVQNGTTTNVGTITLAAVIPFTTEMISGKMFIYADSAGNSGIPMFSGDGTFLDTSITTGDGSGTWSINASGQLVIDGTEAVTLSANTGTDITASAYSSITQTTYTVTLTVVTPTIITVADYAKAVGYLRYINNPGNISHTHYFDGVQSVSGRSVNVLRELDDVGSVLKETIYFSADITTGLYFLGANGTFFVNPFPALLPVFVPGQEYGPYDTMGDGSQMVYVTWTFEDVTVPYGTFTNALKQRTRTVSPGSVDNITYNWYAKDTGGIKWQDGLNTVYDEQLTERNFTWPN